MLGQVGGQAVRRGGLILLGAVVPVIELVPAGEIVAHRPGGQGLTHVAPVPVAPHLHGGGGGAAGPEGLHRQLPIIAV